MKNILFFLLAISSLTSFKAPQVKEFLLAGKWKADGVTNSIDYLIFDSEGYAAMQRGTEVLGGKEFVINGKKGRMTYKTDYSKKPAHLDFVVTKVDSKETMTIKAIIEIINNDEIKVAISEGDDQRPDNFNASTIVFKRVKQ